MINKSFIDLFPQFVVFVLYLRNLCETEGQEDFLYLLLEVLYF